MEHDVNLNIHYTAPDEIWKKIGNVYRSMPYWAGTEQEPKWIGKNIDLWASVESSGIQIVGIMSDDIWETWYDELKAKLTAELGYGIGEPEDGFDFKYWK
ncbi:MAG: hypothetical protein K2N34_08085 [Lachnospiraceae bacterium]|nr:hypothetical protein [Lachnospiraceae bacterium]